MPVYEADGFVCLAEISHLHFGAIAMYRVVLKFQFGFLQAAQTMQPCSESNRRTLLLTIDFSNA